MIQGHLSVAQSTTSRRYGDFFLRHGLKVSSPLLVAPDSLVPSRAKRLACSVLRRLRRTPIEASPSTQTSWQRCCQSHQHRKVGFKEWKQRRLGQSMKGKESTGGHRKTRDGTKRFSLAFSLSYTSFSIDIRYPSFLYRLSSSWIKKLLRIPKKR